MKRAARIAGILAAGVAIIGAAAWLAGRIAPRGYCDAIGAEIRALEIRRARGNPLTRHERGYLAHWYSERAQRCGIPAPKPGRGPRIMYL